MKAAISNTDVGRLTAAPLPAIPSESLLANTTVSDGVNGPQMAASSVAIGPMAGLEQSIHGGQASASLRGQPQMMMAAEGEAAFADTA
jgi:hypothetical protein